MKFFKKSRLLTITMSLVLGMALLTGCGSEDESPGETLSGTITMAGSTSVQPLSEELATAFMQIHKDARLEVSGGGSGGGIKAAQEGAADIGASSRSLKDDEKGVVAYTIAIDGIAVVVHPENDISNMSLEDITKIFLGEITNWSEVGGEDVDIVVVSREEGSGTRGAFDEIVLNNEDLASTAIIQNSTGSVREAVSNDINAIGYVSIGGLNNSVKPVKVDNVEPTTATIQSGAYSIARPFIYLTTEGKEKSALTQAFIDFVLSQEGQSIVSENGYVPVK
ncbi:phosphate ABC transporter substrate-binding protein [Alkalicella caledoniensis]|uniref:Phosphate-binding protein n=1 Tax=Alkalicella caledoniensis TaxID=2731377 RepID=A0A7G9W493_ALKCA|nr:phosphate ABC transporter substrate-binding protein [Alkalicella caledoniensis]QNO13505.1 phosphate ABC transporter substrate-binding protein [Alkalicella caledoniensis]